MDLGNAVLTLTVDSSQLDTGMKKAKEQTDVLQASVTKLVGAYLGFEGIKKVIALIGDCVNEFIESENAATRLTAALRATDQEYTLTSKRLIEFSESLMKTTVYTHEATEGAAAMLIQLGGLTEAGVRRAIPAVMDLASAMGMDLESAATLVSKALAGNVGALSRYGIQIDKASTPSAQFDAVIQALTGHFGGMSEAMAKTTGGQLKQFTNQIGEAKEAAGGFFATFVRGYVQWAREFVEGLRQTGGALKDVWGVWVDITNLRNPFGEDSTNAVRRRKEAQEELNREAGAWYAMEHAGYGSMVQTNAAFDAGKDAVIKFNESFRNVVNNWVALGRAVQDAGIQAGIEAMTDRWVALGEATAEASAKATEAMAEEAQAAWDYWTRVAIAAERARSDAEEFAAEEERLARNYWNMMATVGVKVIGEVDKERDKAHKKEVERQKEILDLATMVSKEIFSQIGTDLAAGELTWESFGETAVHAIGMIISAIGDELAASAAADVVKALAALASIIRAPTAPGLFASAAIKAAGAAAAWVAGAALQAAEFSGGGEFTVPPGYPNDSFPMRVESGEHVSVTPAGAGGELIRVVVNLDGRPIMDAITRASRDRRVLIDARSVVP